MKIDDFFSFFEVSIERIMELEERVMIHGGEPSVVLIGMPKIVFQGRSRPLEVLIKDDLKPGTVIVQ